MANQKRLSVRAVFFAALITPSLNLQRDGWEKIEVDFHILGIHDDLGDIGVDHLFDIP